MEFIHIRDLFVISSKSQFLVLISQIILYNKESENIMQYVLMNTQVQIPAVLFLILTTTLVVKWPLMSLASRTSFTPIWVDTVLSTRWALSIFMRTPEQHLSPVVAWKTLTVIQSSSYPRALFAILYTIFSFFYVSLKLHFCYTQHSGYAAIYTQIFILLVNTKNY